MRYSYTQARKKTPFTEDVQLIISFFSITIIMLLSAYLFLLYKDYSFQNEKKQVIATQMQLKKSIADMKKRIVFVQKEEALGMKIHTQNSVLKDSIANLFDLVPQRITLSEARLLKNGLILYGITPSKDVYNFMLEAPLRSIFQETYSSFYPLKNGWLRFVSTNYMKEDFSSEVGSDAN
ncbi:Putative membrane protein [hydrothermal vent metagenome]|uniref:Putative membrane protein n=1 Tax=hydrothermal vent metagenome TaxID=652676 RepID=A0A1W1BHW4_9ZZZZ